MDFLKARGAKSLNRIDHEMLCLTAALVQAGILFKESRGLDNVDHQNLAALRTHLLHEHISSRFRETRTIDGQ